MALFQENKTGVTANEAGTAGDEDSPAHDFNRFGLLILNQLDFKSLTPQSIEPKVRGSRWTCEERNGGSSVAASDRC